MGFRSKLKKDYGRLSKEPKKMGLKKRADAKGWGMRG